MRTSRLVVVPAVAGSLLLAGCGGTDTATDAASSVAAGAGNSASSAVAGSSSSASASSSTACPTENTRAFAKTRFVADIGLAAGTFHRWIYKPYREGKFNKGADGRTAALVKAGVTAAADAKLISNATKNAKANPTLCKTLAAPLSQLDTKLAGLKNEIRSGNLASIAGAEALVQQILKGSKDAGMPVTERTQ